MMSSFWKKALIRLALTSRCRPVFERDGVKFSLRRAHYQLRGALVSGWEPVFAKLLNLADKDTLFIDIGANVGIASLLVGKIAGAKVIACEPVIGTFSDLVENILLNTNADITPINIAISSTSGILYMTSERSSGINHVVLGEKALLEVRKVPALTLDDFFRLYVGNFARIGNKIGNIVVKVDVERHEIDVLNGSSYLLNKDFPIALCLEFFSDQNLIDINKHLSQFGFFQTAILPSNKIEVANNSTIEDMNAFFVNQQWLDKQLSSIS